MACRSATVRMLNGDRNFKVGMASRETIGFLTWNDWTIGFMWNDWILHVKRLD